MISYDIIATVKNYVFVSVFPYHKMQNHAIRFSSTSSVNSLKERGEERAREKVHVVVVSDPSVSLVSTSSTRRTERGTVKSCACMQLCCVVGDLHLK